MSEPVRPATRELLRRLADAGPPDLRAALRLRGAVASVADGVAQVVGLQGVGSDELVVFSSGVLGMASELEPGRTGVVLLDASERVRAADGVEALGRTPALAVGSDLLGRAIDPLGRPLDDGPVIRGASRPLFREAPRLSERAPVERPLLTGVMVIDAAIPIGRGQRQLVVGDRNVGKTSLALDIVAAQRPGDVFCVYVLVGQPMSRMLGVLESLRDCGALANTVIVAADAATAPGLQYLAPYAGAAIAEFFAERGSDALVVYDDLTKHADAYRELALLLGRAPGREAFPGDIFHIHAQLLERATARSAALGGGSVTAFPIVETTDGDISAYIPTNLISITDGQLYLDTIRFERNQRPAIDLGRSVSRVGGAAQSPRCAGPPATCASSCPASRRSSRSPGSGSTSTRRRARRSSGASSSAGCFDSRASRPGRSPNRSWPSPPPTPDGWTSSRPRPRPTTPGPPSTGWRQTCRRRSRRSRTAPSLPTAGTNASTT